MTEVRQERINQDNVLQEQRRNAEETAAAAAEAEAIIAEIGVLERERDKITSRLKRKSFQILTQFNFQDLEDTHITTINLYSRLNSRIEDWADLLETNEEGDTVYPD